MPVLVLRPQPGAAATTEAARALGLAAEFHPLFAIRPQAWEPVPANAIDGLLLGSANALRHAGPALERYRGMPAYTVGEATAAAAREAGLVVAMVGSGGLQGVLDALPPAPIRLLRLAGRERVTLNVPSDVTLVTCEVYASEPLPLSTALAARLAQPALGLLHSGEAAARLATLCDEAGIARAHLALAALGPRIAARAGHGWRALRSAERPDDAGLLALAHEMCQELSPRP
ncbi:uroporphyrinogen-III synthase [Novosphingobium sp. Rr 2-17]|uniref:uroporphyrinogen-III synthase n=1 Tax=Novosphingobium sp. Rr 2-17 TaxID=555793 RepID=UPI0002698EC8|nr:uroporphyrinogen-III synthase [Novosphingobium sp. Rr 2-17]EIZ79270.1 uroporphyrinogen-III synthase [Novosphingobium sp. Rr 2-17]